MGGWTDHVAVYGVPEMAHETPKTRRWLRLIGRVGVAHAHVHLVHLLQRLAVQLNVKGVDALLHKHTNRGASH